MNIIPIAFAFDNNLVFPACICMSSLMMNAAEDTFYDIFILHSKDVQLDKSKFEILTATYDNCRIQYRVVNDVFAGAFEIRGITTPTYYRLLIPELIPEYDKIIYSDVDVIFRSDLSPVYDVDLTEKYVAATYDIDMNLSVEGRKHIDETPGLEHGEYVQAGFVVLNTKLLREDAVQPKFIEHVGKKYKFQDLDILNIVCNGRIALLPWHYNMTTYSFQYMECDYERIRDKFVNSTLDLAINSSTLHYNGQKPWKGACINFDIWWESYRKSPFFDSKYYYTFFSNMLHEHDRLPLMTRIKILARYFIYGRKD